MVTWVLLFGLCVVGPLVVAQCIGAMGDSLKQADDALQERDDDRA
jgi:hypothetical protein